ncbi:hypothetical protein KEJ27_00140 [Candidatus Bathyarchaeota archaeon]|nr:hypothetical protein [Candidatus Bathyarchaeota archaeon]MBS7618477.1 hypothetical protein [Candidatus Bathyarchaeota archaeon]
MVLAGKIFRLVEDMALDRIAEKLRGYKVEEDFEEEDYKIKLITEVVDLAMGFDSLRGVLAWDVLRFTYHRGRRIPVPKTLYLTFGFFKRPGATFLLVIEKKNLANKAANLFSQLLFISKGYILNVLIKPEKMKEYHEKNPENTKVIFFDSLPIPNVDKLSLYGPDLTQTDLYNNYLKMGSIWYLVTVSNNYGATVGLTRDGVVVAFGNMEKTDFINMVNTEIIPLIS